MDESSKYIYSLATLLKQHLKVKSFKNEMHCLQEMWKRVLKTQNIIGKKISMKMSHRQPLDSSKQI